MCAGRIVEAVTLGPATVTYPADDFELVWLLSGSARWTDVIHGETRSLAPGHLMLLRPGMRDRFVWDRERPTSHGYVHFSLAAAASVDHWPLVRAPAAHEPLPALLRYLLWLADRRRRRRDARRAVDGCHAVRQRAGDVRPLADRLLLFPPVAALSGHTEPTEGTIQ